MLKTLVILAVIAVATSVILSSSHGDKLNKLHINSKKRHKSKKTKNKDRIHISHEYRDPRFVHKLQTPHLGENANDLEKKAGEAAPNLNAPQLKKKEKEYLAKIEDALQNEGGSLLYTNSWAVQLHQAEVAQADRIALKHGFENMGQVRCWPC